MYEFIVIDDSFIHTMADTMKACLCPNDVLHRSYKTGYKLGLDNVCS